MTSRVPWSAEAIEPSVRDRAEAAARRAGMSLNQWLNSGIGEPAPAIRHGSEVAEIHDRLDSIARRIEQMSQPAPRREGSEVARELNEAIARLDARLSQIARPAQASPPPPRQSYTPPPPPPSPFPEWNAAPSYRPAASMMGDSLDFDVTEIVARQRQLNGEPPHRMMQASSPSIAPRMTAAPDLSGFEKQLRYLTNQIEGLRQPDGTEQAVAQLRYELAEMRKAITDALPRRALESLENEIRTVARRIEETRQDGGDDQALHSVEKALRDIHLTLRTLTPAEQLSGFDDAIRKLGSKIDQIVRNSADTGTIKQLESAIGALRTVVGSVASNATVARLSEDIHAVASKVDQLANASSISQSFTGSMASLEQRIAELTSNLQSRERPADNNHLETAVRALSERIDNLRVGSDTSASAQLETAVRALSERIENLRVGSDTPASAQLETAVRALSERIDNLKVGSDASASGQLEAAVRALSERIDNLKIGNDASASNQFETALRALTERIDNLKVGTDPSASSQVETALRALSERVDNLKVGTDPSVFRQFETALRALSERIDNLKVGTDASTASQFENAVRALTERIDQLQVRGDPSAAITHVGQRVSQLLERMEAVDGRVANFGRLEEGLTDILRHLDDQRASFDALKETSRQRTPSNDDFADTIRRELSELHLGRSESERETQEALESVHTTLVHIVDRLATIEDDLRDSRLANAAHELSPQPVGRATHDYAASSPMTSGAIPAPVSAPAWASTAPTAPPHRPELPNPAVNTIPLRAPIPAATTPSMAPVQPAIHEILQSALEEPAAMEPVPQRDPQPPRDSQPPRAAPPARDLSPARAPIDPNLPPDFPLEPGSRLQERSLRLPTPSQRVSASQQALSEIPTAAPEAASTSSFIAAARRAAQAAANSPKEPTKDKRTRALEPPEQAMTQGGSAGTKVASRIRSLLVGASVVVIVLSGFKMAMTMFESGEQAPAALSEPSDLDPPEKANSPSPAMNPGKSSSAAPELTLPAVTSPMPMERQSQAMPIQAAPRQSDVAPTSAVTQKGADVTGTITGSQSPVVPTGEPERRVPVPVTPVTYTPVADTLPDAIGGPALRAAALKGDPTAAYEVAVRFAEGKGVPVNFDEASKWYDRAADSGIVPAMFRLGTLYEKGLGGKKDVDAARRYYIRAAERGNAKAMHNLAVLDADGGNRGPNYKSASQWFRKAADRGVADSQFNLGILYARGIGVEQNLAESFKWFSLAAAQGDADAARKRDDVGKRLDPQSLAAARLAVQTFVAEAQPDDATNVAVPAGGWDGAAAQAATAAQKHGAKTAARPASKQATAH